MYSKQTYPNFCLMKIMTLDHKQKQKKKSLVVHAKCVCEEASFL